MIDWEWGPSAPIVPYPELFAEVLAERAYWEDGEPITLLGPRDAGGVRYVRDYEMPPDIGQGAWRRHDPSHPRCWDCGKFLTRRWMKMYTNGCSHCGEWLGGPW